MVVHRQIRIAAEDGEHAGGLLPRGGELRLCEAYGVLHLLELRARTDARLQQPLLSLEFVLLVHQRIARRNQISQLMAVRRLGRQDLHARGGQLCPRILNGNLIRPRIKLIEHLTALHGLVVINVELDHATRHIGADGRLCGLNR